MDVNEDNEESRAQSVKPTAQQSAILPVTAQRADAQPISAAESASSDDFAAQYLRHVTSEFADEIERLRKAKDFRDSSVPILVEALKQGSEMYSVDERTRLAKGWAAASGSS